MENLTKARKSLQKLLSRYRKSGERCRYCTKNTERMEERHEIRPLDVEIDILPMTHGSALLFTRGETQALVTVTLEAKRMSK